MSEQKEKRPPLLSQMRKEERLAAQKSDLEAKVSKVVAAVGEGRAGGKRRPVVERIAGLQGRTCFTDGQGFGGLPSLTDQDIAGALAMIRRDRNLVRGDIAPELLITYYGCTGAHRSVLRAAYLRAHPATERVRIPCRRLAATLAVQMVAGLQISFAQQQEYAYIAHVRLETMRDEIADAFLWFEGMVKAAEESFRAVIRDVREAREAGEEAAIEERRPVYEAHRAKRQQEVEEAERAAADRLCAEPN